MAIRLENTNILCLFNEISSAFASDFIVELLKLEAEGQKEVTIYINSPGGSIIDGLAIIDTINHLKLQVSTVVVGLSASMAAVISSSGFKGKRYALRHSKFIIHQPLVSAGGTNQETDIRILAQSMSKDRSIVENILANNTEKDINQIHIDCERDYYLDAEEALKYGLIDKII